MINPTFRQLAWPHKAFKRTTAATALALAVSLTGCANTLSGAGPYMGEIEKSDGYALIDVTPQTITPYLRSPEKVPAAIDTSLTAPHIRLAAGDVISIMISDNAPEGSGLFAPLVTGGSRFQTRIDAEGKISLPYVGRHTVAGMSLPQVESMIRQRLNGVSADPQAHVELEGDLSGSVLLAGAVKTPGRYSTLDGPLTLLDAINQAGGTTLDPHLIKVTVRDDNQARVFNYQDVLDGENIVLQPRSQVILDRARQRFVAMGSVGKPGLHDLPSQYPSLLEALGSVGGLKENSANPQGVFVFRLGEGADNQPQALVFRLDMRNPAAIFLARQFLLRPEDAIYVTNAPVYEWQKIISPIVQTLVLGRTVNGF